MAQQLHDKETIPFFSISFRPFFLAGAFFSVIAIFVWIGVLNNYIEFHPYAGSFWWHTHEMLYGFVVAIITGFLLTAVQNWTGLTSVKGLSLMLLLLLWLAGRLLLAIDFSFSDWVVVAVDLAFLPLVTLVLTRLIIRVKLWRNLIFVPVLTFMTLANALMHYGAMNNLPELVVQGSYAMIMFIVLLITILGGRVFPMFTANGTGTKKIDVIPLLEKCTIVSTMFIALIYISGMLLPTSLMALLLIFSACCHLARLLRWRFWVTLKTPLVWSLHLGYLGIPIGFFLMAYHYVGGDIQMSTAIHGLTVGAIGSTVLSMITRVSLGHTGRKLLAGKVMTLAFVFVGCAVVVRVFYSFVNEDYLLSMTVAAFFWMLAYGAYTFLFFPKFLSKRL